MRGALAWAVALLMVLGRVATAQLPPGFQEVVVVSGLSGPTTMAYAPDGRLFIGQQTGAVRVFKQGQLLVASFVVLNVRSDSERGLFGLAFEPGFPVEPYLYLYYGDGTTSTPANPSHTYGQAGTYTVTLDVSDGRGGVTRATPLRIRAENIPPPVAISSPIDESRYNAGDTISFRGTATDAEDGTLLPS